MPQYTQRTLKIEECRQLLEDNGISKWTNELSSTRFSHSKYKDLSQEPYIFRASSNHYYNEVCFHYCHFGTNIVEKTLEDPVVFFLTGNL